MRNKVQVTAMVKRMHAYLVNIVDYYGDTDTHKEEYETSVWHVILDSKTNWYTLTVWYSLSGRILFDIA